MKNSPSRLRLSSLLPALATGLALLGGLDQASAINATSSGNWATGSNWSTGAAPGSGASADTVVILGGNTITLDTVVPSGAGSVFTVVIGNTASSTGTLLINAGGSLTSTGIARVMAVSNGLNAANGVLTMTGGSASFGSALSVGLGSATQVGNGTGTMSLSGASSVTVAGPYTIGSSVAAQGTGILNIAGSNVNFAGNSTLVMNSFSTINFTFDSVGISDLTFTGAGTINAGSAIVVNAGSFAGAGTYTLIDAASFSATPTISLVGFGAGSSYNWDTATGLFTVNAVAVPEPSTYALLGLGAVVAGVAWKRRRRVA